MQAIPTKEPQQITRYQMGDLGIALDHLADQVLAQVLALQRVLRQQGEQLVEALEEQGVAFLRDLFGFTQRGQDGAQVVEQLQVVFQVGVGHGGGPRGG